MAAVVALVDDVFFQAKLFETAKQVGVELRACATQEALATEISRERPKLVIVDLNARSNPLAAIEQLQSNGGETPLIGFFSHVQSELAERARAAGCKNLMPRSKFTQNLATILAEAKSQS
jgi:DNA-binding NarL/FixJ family response regulator